MYIFQFKRYSAPDVPIFYYTRTHTHPFLTKRIKYFVGEFIMFHTR